MSESKRRKQHDINYGKPSKIEIRNENGEKTEILAINHFGFYDAEKKLFSHLTDEQTGKFIENLIKLCLPQLLSKYGNQMIIYKYEIDFTNFLRTNKSVLKFYPQKWDNEPEQMRNFRNLEINITPVR